MGEWLELSVEDDSAEYPRMKFADLLYDRSAGACLRAVAPATPDFVRPIVSPGGV